MSTRKQSPRTRAFRPVGDALEDRQLLSGLVTGQDAAGDTWKLQLIGPGSLSVVKQNGADGNPAPLNSLTDINTITIGGTQYNKSRLIGTVVSKGAGSDGRVFFQNFIQLAGRSELTPSAGQSLLAISMPNFWLGNTTPLSSATTTQPAAPKIELPDGVNTLQFGGIDRTHLQPAATSTSTSDTAAVVLGLPPYGGSRIIINQSITDSQSAPPASGSTTPTTIQHGATFAVSGRLQLFQANSIAGDAATPPGWFSNKNSAATGSGGTVVESTVAGQTLFNSLNVDGEKGAVGGQIGFVRIGGNATNFATSVEDPLTGSTALITNFFIGGETNNVLLIAPNGSKNIYFGKGMDNVDIRSHTINSLQANRGAINSTVAVDRQIGQANFGGDVVNTTVLSGDTQNFSKIISTVTGASTSSLFAGTPAPAPLPTIAQTSGSIVVHIAGSVQDSVFAASVQPDSNGKFGGPNSLVLPTGKINAKVEGTINNATATPSSPSTAFFAKTVKLVTAPVAPPTVPEAPFPIVTQQPFLPGIHYAAQKSVANAATRTIAQKDTHKVTTPTGTTTAAKTKA